MRQAQECRTRQPSHLRAHGTAEARSRTRLPVLLRRGRDRLESVTSGHGQRFLRFGLVGASGVVVNMVLMYLLVEAGHVEHVIAGALAAEASILSNFALNDHWTFRDARQPTSSWLRRASKYNAVALSGTALSLVVLALLMASFGLHYLVANFLAIGTATLSNYALNSRFTWATGLTSARPTPALAPLADW